MNYQKLMDACFKCVTDCALCLDKMATMKSENDCPRCCVACIDICNLCIKSTARQSPFASKIHQLCADICDWCAEQCEAHDHDHCQQCAKSCRACAKLCRAAIAVAA